MVGRRISKGEKSKYTFLLLVELQILFLVLFMHNDGWNYRQVVEVLVNFYCLRSSMI